MSLTYEGLERRTQVINQDAEQIARLNEERRSFITPSSTEAFPRSFGHGLDVRLQLLLELLPLGADGFRRLLRDLSRPAGLGQDLGFLLPDFASVASYSFLTAARSAETYPDIPEIATPPAPRVFCRFRS